MNQIDHHSIWLNVVLQNDYQLGFNPMGETVWMSLHDVLEADMRDMLTGIERSCYLMDDVHEDEHDRVVARKWTVTIVVAWVDLFCRALEHTVKIVSEGLVRRLAADGHLSEEVLQAHAASLQEVRSQTAHIEHCKDVIDKAEETYVGTGMSMSRASSMSALLCIAPNPNPNAYSNPNTDSNTDTDRQVREAASCSGRSEA